MSKDPFFILKEPYEVVDKERLSALMVTGSCLANVLYLPDVLDAIKVVGVTFKNVSFSKTSIKNVTFRNCNFIDCLFIGSVLDGVDFHACKFSNCNFYKAALTRVYGEPRQFVAVVRDHRYANIAVHFFQELRDNYSDEMQPEFRGVAEYWFNVWKRRLAWNESVASTGWFNRAVGFLGWLKSAMYDVAFGYGYKLHVLLRTTVFAVFVSTTIAYVFYSRLFVDNGEVTVIRSIYYSLTTMVTMGAVGFTPSSELGYAFVAINALVGLLLISATVTQIAKKVAR